ncbi:unnamed protein product, partial [Timema podura]|nr:unnamed protein product [Timema podura]
VPQLQSGVIVIPKSTNPERLKQNMDVFDFTINDKDVKYIESLDCNGRTCPFTDDQSVAATAVIMSDVQAISLSQRLDVHT